MKQMKGGSRAITSAPEFRALRTKSAGRRWLIKMARPADRPDGGEGGEEQERSVWPPRFEPEGFQVGGVVVGTRAAMARGGVRFVPAGGPFVGATEALGIDEALREQRSTAVLLVATTPAGIARPSPRLARLGFSRQKQAGCTTSLSRSARVRGSSAIQASRACRRFGRCTPQTHAVQRPAHSANYQARSPATGACGR
jgi:hypothetical protein